MKATFLGAASRQTGKRTTRSCSAGCRNSGEKGVLVGGEAFETEETKPVTIRFAEDGTSTTTEEPFADVEETLGGYFVVEVDSRDEAVKIAETLPTGETIEVRPII